MLRIGIQTSVQMQTQVSNQNIVTANIVLFTVGHNNEIKLLLLIILQWRGQPENLVML